MRKLFSIVLASAVVGCSPAYAFSVGDDVPVQVVCQHQETIENHIDLFVRYGAEGVNEQFKTDVKSGECLVVPSTIVTVEEVGKVRPPVKWPDGDMVRIQAVKVKGVWSLTVEKVEPTV